MNNGYTELAKMLKNLNKGETYGPVFGRITQLPDLIITRSNNIQLTKNHVVSIVNLYERDGEGRYIHNGKKVVLLPYNNDNSYIVLGVIQDG